MSFKCVLEDVTTITNADTNLVTFSSPGCQRQVGLSRGKAKVCYYSGWYYCQNCHQDNSFLIPARLLHNWDTSKHKVRKYQNIHTDCTKLLYRLLQICLIFREIILRLGPCIMEDGALLLLFCYSFRTLSCSFRCPNKPRNSWSLCMRSLCWMSSS